MIGPRVLFIQTQAENAGAQEVSRLIGSELASRGYDVKHLFFYRKSDEFSEPPNATILCERRPSGVLSFLAFLTALFRYVRDYKPNCVFCFQHFGNVLGAPIARLAGCKKIVANQVTAMCLVNPAIAFADKIFGSVGIYDHVTANSEALYDIYAKLPAQYVKKLSLIPQGFEDKTQKIEKVCARRRLGLPETVSLIGCTARLNPAKQLDKVISLLPSNPSWHFAIAGQGPDYDRLVKFTAALKMTSRVHFIGELAPDQVGLFLAGLDVFAFPSAAESFGLAAIEAAQAGVPVVANTLPVLREVLRTKDGPCAAFVDVADQQAFARQIEAILLDRRVADRLSERGQQLNKKYSLEKMVDAYEAFVNDQNVPPSANPKLPALQ